MKLIIGAWSTFGLAVLASSSRIKVLPALMPLNSLTTALLALPVVANDFLVTGTGAVFPYERAVFTVKTVHITIVGTEIGAAVGNRHVIRVVVVHSRQIFGGHRRPVWAYEQEHISIADKVSEVTPLRAISDQ